MIRSEKVRHLTAEQLGLVASKPASPEPPPAALADEAVLDENNPYLVAVRDAIADGYAGAIFTGVPGTGKSRMAALVAESLTGGNPSRAPFVQFHSSYQYEDFIEGYVPSGDSFARQLKTFGLLCLEASEHPEDLYILVIDEISRADVSRVFGEALTYIERSKRDRPFKLASGTDLMVPANLFVLGTMNPWDRGVEELDTAFERRFAFIDMPPDGSALQELLRTNGLDESLSDKLLSFFNYLMSLSNTRCHLGHGFFVHVRDAASLQRLWTLQLRHVLRRACRDDDSAFSQIESRWIALQSPPPPQQQS